MNSSDALATWQPLKDHLWLTAATLEGAVRQGCCLRTLSSGRLLALPNSMASVFRIPADLQVSSAGYQTFQVISRVALTGETNSRSLKALDFHVSGISRDPKWSYNHAM